MKLASFRAGGIERIGVETSAGMADIAALIDSPADMASLTTTGLIHVAISLVSFVCMIVAMFIFVRTFALEPRWRSLTPWIVLLPASALSLMFVQSQGPWVGIMQRLMVGVISAWMVIVAVRVRAIAASGAADS